MKGLKQFLDEKIQDTKEKSAAQEPHALYNSEVLRYLEGRLAPTGWYGTT